MWIIGDVHGLYSTYLWLLKQKGHEDSLQLGDMGIGFSSFYDNELTNKIKDLHQHKFFRGNHDDPQKCRFHPNYLSDWGYDELTGIFHIGGGLSIDQDYRKAVESSNGTKLWWSDEQLSQDELTQVVSYYEQIKPDIVISHECPYELISEVNNKDFASQAKKMGRSRTSMALQVMYDIYQPETWIFGHYHTRKTIKKERTRFEALDMIRSPGLKGWIDRCCIELPGLSWDEANK